jgi:hypothetical protein
VFDEPPVVVLQYEKWGGRPHYCGAVFHLGDAEFGTWLWGPVGRTIYRGETPAFVTEQPSLTLVPPDAWWAPSWWLEHPEITLYVNINTPALWNNGHAVSVDLDLDVVAFVDGRVEVVDQDEFAEHRQMYGYPPRIVAGAEHAAATVRDLVCRGEPLFDGVRAQSWSSRALSSNLTPPAILPELHGDASGTAPP